MSNIETNKTEIIAIYLGNMDCGQVYEIILLNSFI
jgi:hypothetical protein